MICLQNALISNIIVFKLKFNNFRNHLFHINVFSCSFNIVLSSLPEHFSHSVFIHVGIGERWKQVVAYHFTGKSIAGVALKNLVTTVINMASEIELQVVAVTSDMGPANQAMWRSFGICSSRTQLVSYIPHPTATNCHLHFLADIPHVLKNLCSALCRQKTFTLTEDMCSMNGLPSREVCLSHITYLASFQDQKDLKLAPKLTVESVTSTSHFKKMNVAHALNIFSHSVSAGLRYLVEKEGYSQNLLTTAWFIELVHNWFKFMSSRHPVLALSQRNILEYSKAITLLNNFISIMNSIQIGNKVIWKPVQCGIQLSTCSIINLCKELLEKDLSFLLTSRFSQDCVENLFSLVRSRNPVPSAREFKYSLKLICVAQYLKHVKSSNYEEDERQYLGDLLPASIIIPASPETELIETQFVESEEQSLYYLAGYCIQSLKKQNQLCDNCLNALRHHGPTPHQLSKLLEFKSFKNGALFEVNEEIYRLFAGWERIVRSYEPRLKMTAIGKILASHLLAIDHAHIKFPSCHPVVSKLAKKFVNFRLHAMCKKQSAQIPLAVTFGSASMAKHALVKNV